MALADIEERLAIHDLFSRYMRGVDNWDEELLFSCFTADGAIEGSMLGNYTGRAGQRAWIEAGRKAGQGSQTRHLFSNLEVELAGERARARAYLAVFITKDKQSRLYVCGHYDCDVVKDGGQWRFSNRRVLIDSRE